MKRLSIALFSCLTIVALALPTMAAEMRGLWVDAFHPGIKSPAQTDKMIAEAKECNFNTLFVQVRKRGNTYYKSAIEPMAPDVATGYDPLADVVTKAHAAGLRVHAWISVYEAYNPSKWTKVAPNQVHQTHPDWLMKDYEGETVFMPNDVYLDPGNPSVRTYLAGIVSEIARNYQVDGIHLDGVRYPGQDSGYNDISVSLFNRANHRTGKPDPQDPAWCSWRRNQIDQFISLAFQKVPKNKRPVQLSAAVTENMTGGYEVEFQDWKNWVRSGTIDFLVPMVFVTDSRVFESVATKLIEGVGARYICIGQAGYKMDSEKGINQISMARTLGAAGEVVYNYSYCSKTSKVSPVALMDALKSGLYAQPDSSPF